MKTIKHKFVEFIPEILEEGILYITVNYCTATHKCVCGCGNKVITPIRPTDWQLYFNGKTVSLTPSIGNWSFDCKSHYFITNNEIRYARKWQNFEIAEGREDGEKKKKSFFSKLKIKKK